MIAVTPFLLRRNKCITDTIHSISYFVSVSKWKRVPTLLKQTCYIEDKHRVKKDVIMLQMRMSYYREQEGLWC